MTLIVPERLAATCGAAPERRAWLEQLPNAIGELQDRWLLRLDAPFENEVSCAWAAPAVRRDGRRGEALVVLVANGIGHFDVDDDECWHRDIMTWRS